MPTDNEIAQQAIRLARIARTVANTIISVPRYDEPTQQTQPRRQRTPGIEISLDSPIGEPTEPMDTRRIGNEDLILSALLLRFLGNNGSD